MSSDTLGRPVRAAAAPLQANLFGKVAVPVTDSDPHYWGMPAFQMGDATPSHSVTINFMSAEDLRAFAALTGIPLTTRSDSAWYPPQAPLKGEYRYDGPPSPTRYPVCIPSKGRADCQTTGHLLNRMGVPHTFFVEQTEAEWYREHVGADKVVSMPFNDLGQGSIPARNFIWEWCKDRGAAWHWIMDDNISLFARNTNNRRLSVYGGGFFAAIEAFAERYDNLAIVGPHGKGFVSDRSPRPPLLWNSRVYSCSLINTSLPYRWRGRYNEDTDLCLRALTDGWATLLFRSLLFQKGGTVGSATPPMKGGNTDNVYTDGDHRRAFAESLREQHPDVVKVVWKFNRWHHEVDYRPFARNDPKLKAGIVPHKRTNDYGMVLRNVKAGDGQEEP